MHGSPDPRTVYKPPRIEPNTMRRTLSALALAALAAVPSVHAAAVKYAIDPVHSYVLFSVVHLGASTNHGRFDKLSGTVIFDDADPAKSQIDITVDAASVNTGIPKRDDHLRSPDFFNARQFPTITFKSTAVKKLDAKRFEATGNLTLNGVTKVVSVPFNLIGTGKNMDGKEVIGADAQLTIKRSDYNVKALVGPVSDEVRLTISIEGIKG